MNKKITIAGLFIGLTAALFAATGDNVIEEVAWMIGDEPIYKSDIEQAYMEMQNDRQTIQGDPYCVIPEELAIERLFLHQADIDTVEVQESMVQLQVDAQMNFLITNLGSREKVEQYFRKSYPEIREQYSTSIRNRSRVQQVRSGLTKNLKVTPGDVRRYFEKLPADSIPYVPLQVGVQIITINPLVPRQEIEDVKARLRDYADRINRGETDFHTLAVLYSEAPEGIRGGELGFMGRAQLVPEYAAVAFNLNDPKKVSKIVETEFGFHIIQLIEKRGDRINTRHILLRPKVSEKDLADAVVRLDSLRNDIVDKKTMTFEDGVRLMSQDKDTKMSHGVMVNTDQESVHYGTTNFEMSELPQEVAREVAKLQPGEVSQPFRMRDPKRDREIVAMVKLAERIPAHQANLADDYQTIKDMYESAQSQAIVDKWLDEKIRDTYVRIEEGWRGCDFRHKGWVRKD